MPNRMVRDHPDLPTDLTSHYCPRGPSAKNLPILPHLFETLSCACPLPCTWPVPHDCLQPQQVMGGHDAANIERIPKRNTSFEGDRASPVVWGLEPVYAVSFAYVLVYHGVMVVGISSTACNSGSHQLMSSMSIRSAVRRWGNRREAPLVAV